MVILQQTTHVLLLELPLVLILLHLVHLVHVLHEQGHLRLTHLWIRRERL